MLNIEQLILHERHVIHLQLHCRLTTRGGGDDAGNLSGDFRPRMVPITLMCLRHPISYPHGT